MSQFLVQAAEEGTLTDAPDDTTVATLFDRSGAILSVVTTRQGEIVCAKPAFAVRETPEVSVTIMEVLGSPDGCPHCDLLVVETHSGILAPVEVHALPLYRQELGRGVSVAMGITAFASELTAWPDEETFTRAHKTEPVAPAAQSFVPSGILSDDPDWQPTATATLRGTVAAGQWHRNFLSGGRFAHMTVTSLDLELDIVAEPDLVGHTVPPAGAVVSAFVALLGHSPRIL